MTSQIIMPHETLFFCFGQPKSGTTFLQRMLNSHPDISCPSEHQFDALRNGFSSFFDWYNNALQLVDKRTGGQGATAVDSDAQAQIFKIAVEIIIKHAAGGKMIMGANDNAILNHLEQYGILFGPQKMLAIFRNPIDAGISAWHHNRRVAREEGKPEHEELMMQYGGFEGWLRQYARWFRNSLASFISHSEQHGNTLLLRYEDLVADTAGHIKRVYAFLGADTHDELINNIVEKTSFTAMKKASRYPGFFRSSSTSLGNSEVTDGLRGELQAIAGPELATLGYNLIESRLLDIGGAGRSPLPWTQG